MEGRTEEQEAEYPEGAERTERKRRDMRRKKEEATGNRSGKPKRRRKPKGGGRERASRGSHLQGRDGGRRKEIADEAACI